MPSPGSRPLTPKGRSLSPSGSLRFIGPLERALFLKSLGPLENLSPAQIAVFAEHAVERSYRAGQKIFTGGERLRAYHVVVEGRVRAVGGEYLTGVEIGPREAIGFLSMFARQANGLDVEALEDTVVLEFSEDVFLDIMEDDFGITAGLIQRLAKGTLQRRRGIKNGAYLAPRENEVQWSDGQLDFVERVMLLRGPGESVFRSAGLAGVLRIAQATPTLEFPPGTTLWKSGDRSDHMLILISGTVGCTLQWGYSRFRAGPGYPLGNLERFADEPRWYTAVTETHVVALRSDTEVILDILEDHFDLALALTRAMATRRIEIQEEVAAEAAVVAAENVA